MYAMRRTLMRVPVVRVGIVRVAMLKRLVHMAMGMWLLPIPVRTMMMLVMFITGVSAILLGPAIIPFTQAIAIGLTNPLLRSPRSSDVLIEFFRARSLVR
jgi:hypothetical protein